MYTPQLRIPEMSGWYTVPGEYSLMSEAILMTDLDAEALLHVGARDVECRVLDADGIVAIEWSHWAPRRRAVAREHNGHGPGEEKQSA